MFKKIFITLLFLNFMAVDYSYASNNSAKKLAIPKVILQLDAITIDRLVEDKIYIEITEYSNLHKAKEYRIPTYPKHWLIKDLPKLKNIELWQGAVNKLENIELVVSVVDNDFPPFDSDRPLGSVKLKLENKHNLININWDSANFKEPIQIEKISHTKSPNHVKFKMKNQNSEYIIGFVVKVINLD